MQACSLHLPTPAAHRASPASDHLGSRKLNHIAIEPPKLPNVAKCALDPNFGAEKCAVEQRSRQRSPVRYDLLSELCTLRLNFLCHSSYICCARKPFLKTDELTVSTESIRLANPGYVASN